ncbi:hypothetical protein AALD19_11535, partial [Bacteroides acidifaciens]|uniref:hypothetical protein n=1 Tax=Bacteroides acidifaciens TaxID=85831 RepID=UPI003518798C
MQKFLNQISIIISSLLKVTIHKLKFGKKEKPLEVEAVAPQEVIAPMAEETAIAEETSDKEPVQE